MKLLQHFITIAVASVDIRDNTIAETARMDPASIAECELTKAGTKEVTSFKELWRDQTCVIIFLRRFG